MIHGTTTVRHSGLYRSAWLQFANVLVASLGAAWDGWQEARRMHAEQAALRGLDRRARQDLGLHAVDDPRSDAITRHYDLLRW